MQAALVLGGVAFVFFRGPLPRVYSVPDNCTSLSAYYALRPFVYRPDRMPEIYHYLSDQQGCIDVIEAPWARDWPVANYALYQHLHRKEFRIAFTDETFFVPGGAFRQFVRIEDAIYEPGRDTIVLLHKDLAAERQSSIGRAAREEMRLVGSSVAPFASMLKVCEDRGDLHRCYEDEWIVAFAGNREEAGRIDEWRSRVKSADASQ